MVKRIDGERENVLRVLHVAPTPFFSDRGCHVRIQGIVSALNKKSVRNIVCTYHHGRDVPGVETRRIPQIPGYTKREAGPSPFKYLADLVLFIKVLIVTWKNYPDVIHGHLHEGTLIGWAVKTAFFWRTMPLISDIQGSLVGELEAHGYFENRAGLKQVFWKMEHYISRLPDFIICSSGASANILRSEFRVNSNRLEVVNDGVDAAVTNSPRDEGLRSQLGLPRNCPVVVYTGALLPAKGVNVLKGIIREAVQQGLAGHFLIVGYPEEEMKEFVQRHDVGQYCTVTGRVPFENLSDYLGLATVAIEPKEADSGEASGKLLNYMGAGLPVVCFDTEKNKELLGEAGTFVRQGSVQAFVERIEALLEGPDLCDRKGKMARRRAQDKFSWDASAERIYSVYRTQLAKTG
jgi:glycosyltransferase involved in cell wall biosynthesis